MHSFGAYRIHEGSTLRSSFIKLRVTNVALENVTFHSFRTDSDFFIGCRMFMSRNHLLFVGFESWSAPLLFACNKVSKRAKIRNRYNQAPHLTQDTNGKVITLQLDITHESQEVSPFSAGDHKALINRHARKHNKNKTEIT